MARTATGSVVFDERRREPAFAIRFRANGQRQFVTLGTKAEGWTQARADQALADTLADVRRGLWRPPVKPEAAPLPREVPTFHEFASEWFERQLVEGGRRGGGLTEAGAADLKWRLANHLLPYFAAMRLDAITVQQVDEYRLAKVRDGKLGATSINKTLTVLASILESASEYEYVSRNVASGRRRRLPSVTPTRTVVDRADHIAALLDAAGELDREARSRIGQRRALVATLTFAGLRIGEALALQWRDVDLGRGVMKVRQGKTDAAARDVPILLVLRDELIGYKTRLNPEPDALVFGSSAGQPQSPSNIRTRILAPSVTAANEALAKAKVLEPIPALTPHSLRRTAASIWFAIGWTPPRVMAAMGHTDAAMTLNVYARQMARQDGEPERLKALVEGADWAAMGSSDDIGVQDDQQTEAL